MNGASSSRLDQGPFCRTNKCSRALPSGVASWESWRSSGSFPLQTWRKYSVSIRRAASTSLASAARSPAASPDSGAPTSVGAKRAAMRCRAATSVAMASSRAERTMYARLPDRYTACMRFGIDFGTTHTVVATIDRGNYPVVSFEHADVVPSIVSVDPQGELHYGRAERGWTVLRSFKRLLDEGHPDTEVRVGGRSIALADLLTGFLAHVREQILHHSNAGLRKKDKVEAAVSVPANASTAQRLITMDAYRRAGFDVKAVLNEPSAAGFEYAHRFRETVTSKREYVLVYDLGGGTFDASLIHMEGRTNEVITSAGISRLGGDDFDEAIARMVLDRRGGGELTQQLLDEVREQKEALNPNSRKFILDETVLGVEEVYDSCTPLIEQTLVAMEAAMRDPRRGEDEVAWTELAG